MPRKTCIRIRIQLDPYINGSPGSGSVYCQSDGSGFVFRIYGSATLLCTGIYAFAIYNITVIFTLYCSVRSRGRIEVENVELVFVLQCSTFFFLYLQVYQICHLHHIFLNFFTH